MIVIGVIILLSQLSKIWQTNMVATVGNHGCYRLIWLVQVHVMVATCCCHGCYRQVDITLATSKLLNCYLELDGLKHLAFMSKSYLKAFPWHYLSSDDSA